MSSVTFGSVGDIISVCLLVKDVVDALDQSRGSSAEYQALVRELGSLERSLLEVDILSRSQSSSDDIVGICNAARQSVENCRTSLQTFSKKISRYDLALSENGPKRLMHDVSMKIRWHVTEKEAIAKFRADVAAHSNALNMLLATANVKLAQNNNSKLEQLASTTQASVQHRDGQLLRILDKLEHSSSLLLDGKALLAKLWSGITCLQQLSLDVKDSVKRILSLNVATYNAVLAIHSGLPNRLERTLIGEPAILEDALGRLAPVHLQFITSWEALEAVLEVRFRGLEGHEMITRREFVLQEHATGFEVLRSRPWEGSILPGQRIEMSFVFNSQKSSPNTATDASCPKCGFVSFARQDSEVQCSKCHLYYRRITEVEEVEASPPNPTPVSKRTEPAFGQNPFGPLPPPSSSSSKRKREDGFDDTLVRFKRVRLVSKQVKLRSSAIFGGAQHIKWPEPAPEITNSRWARSKAGDAKRGDFEKTPIVNASLSHPSDAGAGILRFKSDGNSNNQDTRHVVGWRTNFDASKARVNHRQINDCADHYDQPSTSLPDVENAAASLGDGHDSSNHENSSPLGVLDTHVRPEDETNPKNGWTRYEKSRFQFLRTIGTGSCARVKLVQSNFNQRYYAVKVLSKPRQTRLELVKQTYNEVRILSLLRHPFIFKLWGTFQDPQSLYIVTDFIEGGELFTLLRKAERFPDPVAKFYAAEVLLALEYLHSKDIIYRSIKPEDILLDRHGHVKLIDFGSAKHAPNGTGTFCGLLDYVAPEIIIHGKGEKYTKCSDWWSWGILIFEMLSGDTPFHAGDEDSPMEFYKRFITRSISYPPYLHSDAQNLLKQVLVRFPAHRLGHLEGDIQLIKQHAWFAEVTWDRLLQKDYDAPYVPPVNAGKGDASQFLMPEEDDSGEEESEEYGDVFADF